MSAEVAYHVCSIPVIIYDVRRSSCLRWQRSCLTVHILLQHVACGNHNFVIFADNPGVTVYVGSTAGKVDLSSVAVTVFVGIAQLLIAYVKSIVYVGEALSQSA